MEGQVWFGVGTFGTSDDEMMGLGNCYRHGGKIYWLPLPLILVLSL